MPLGSKISRPGGHMFYIGLYRENVKNLLVWNQKEKTIDIWYLASPSRNTTKLVQIIDLGPEIAPPKGSHVLGLYRENVKKIFLSETMGLRALIFGI